MKKKKSDSPQESQLLFYQTEDGQTRLEVQLKGETVWLTQAQMAQLFQRDRSVITKHITNIFAEGELTSDSVSANFAHTAPDGKTYDVISYNLDVIISVGYRVKSHRGTQFRIWSTQRLREFIVKGFTLDDERLKQADGSNYFDELLDRIRDIRSSEKVFWRKVLDIYATSIDYDPNTEASQKFFATIQNKMHWAAHGQTAAEVITERADASKPYMGLTSWSGTKLRKSDVSIAKNYLNEKELNLLNRIVTAYLEFAELQAVRQKAMYMKDWIAKLDDFLRLSDHDILTHVGKISHEVAVTKAETEFESYRQKKLNEPSAIEKDFEKAISKIERLKLKAPGKPKKK